MECEIICIGLEILDGRVIDTNSSFLGQELRNLGLCPRFAQRVDDDISRITKAFEIAEGRSQIIIVSGGLGPTSDDLTLEAFAKYKGLKLNENPEALQMIETAFKRLERPFTPVQRKQALLPVASTPIENELGTAPAVEFNDNGCHWFFLPGVPRELKNIFHKNLKPKLSKYQSVTPLVRTWQTQFTSEGKLEELLKPIQNQLPKSYELAYRTRYPENFVSLIDNLSQKNEFNAFADEIQKVLGKDSFAVVDNLDTLELEELVIKTAIEKNVFLGTVESCTGGLVAHRLTQVAGSSKVFMGSWVCYADEMKINLGVSKGTLQFFGAVSKECATEMAEAGLKKLLTNFQNAHFLVVSTTGIAGPDGGSQDKPVGLCHLGLAESHKRSVHLEIHGRPNLERNLQKQFFSQHALNLLLKELNSLKA